MIWFITDESYMGSSELEELGMFAFAALQELSFSLWVLCDIQNWAQGLSIGIFTFHSIEWFL